MDCASEMSGTSEEPAATPPGGPAGLPAPRDESIPVGVRHAPTERLPNNWTSPPSEPSRRPRGACAWQDRPAPPPPDAGASTEREKCEAVITPPPPDAGASVSPDPASPAASAPRGSSLPRRSAARGRTPCLLRHARAAALAAAAVLATALPVHAQTSIQLVSTLGQSTSSLSSIRQDYLYQSDAAQAFTTGTHANGYRLTSVDLDLWVSGSSSNHDYVYGVSIWSADATGGPDTSLGTLRNPTLSLGHEERTHTYTATGAGIDLETSTTYVIVVDVSTVGGCCGGVAIRNTTSDNEDTDQATGWSIANDSLYRSWDSSGSWSPFTQTRQIRVNGYANTAPTADTGTAPTADNGTVATFEDGFYLFGPADFNFADSDTGDRLESVTIVTLPVAGSLTLDGAAVSANDVVDVDDIRAYKLVFTPDTGTSGNPYAVFIFKVSDGEAESRAFYRMTVIVTTSAARSTALVSNLEQNGFNRLMIISGVQHMAGVFDTGVYGATLTSIDFRLRSADSPNAELPPAVLYRFNHRHGVLGTRVATLVTPSSPSIARTVRTFNYRAPAGTTLAADTDYIVVLGGGFRTYPQITNSLSMDAEAEWRIRPYMDGVSTFGWGSGRLLMRANGTLIERARITDVVVTSTPKLRRAGSSTFDTYGLNETIEITITVSEAVDVEGDPEFRFSMSNPGGTDNEVGAAYDRAGSTDTALKFRYTVQAGDEDIDGIWIGNQTRSFDLDSNDYIRTRLSQIDLNLRHDAINTQSGHKVDGSRRVDIPTVTSIERQTPSSSPTNADSLKWRITFSKNVKNVDAADFAIGGTTAMLAVTKVTASAVYDVTASGGNLAGLDATVTLSFASGWNIADTDDNALSNTMPTGTNDNTYVVDNTAPTVAISGVPVTSSAPFTARFTFSEAVTGFVAGDITVGNGAASAFTATTAGLVYTALITPAADGAVTVDVAAGVAEDAANNGNTAATQATSINTYVVVDNTAPTVTISGVSVTSSAPFTARFTFSEAVTGFVAGDITVGNGAASAFTATTAGLVYTALITPAADGVVTVDVAAGVAEDAANNGNTAAIQATSIYTAMAVLVSNIGQAEEDVMEFGFHDVAQPFTTGTHAAGYTLTSIQLRLDTTTGTTPPTVRLHSGSATGTRVATFAGPASLTPNSTANYPFTPTGTVTLSMGTTYWVVAEGGSSGVSWWTTVSDDEDATSAVDWSIGNTGESRTASSPGSFTTIASGQSYQMRVNGTPGPTTPGPTTPGPTTPTGGGTGGGGGGGDDHGNTPGQATPIALDPASTPGQLHTATDVDYFSVDIPHAGALVVETSGPTDTVGTVWQAGEELATADSGGAGQNFRLSVRVAPGEVVIAVAGNGQQTGRYTLHVTFLPGYLENPGAASFQSGIGLISGWTCAAEAVEIVLNGEPQEAAYGTARLDTEAVCGDSDNGFGLLFNWNLLGDGEHEVVALVDGVELDRATVTVTTLGAEFLRDATGTCTAADFPTMDETVTLAWQQTQQNFVIVDGAAPAGTNRVGRAGVGYLENPGPNSYQSGIGVLSGWVCEGAEVIIELNGAPQPAAYGTERLDTEEACGDTDNGFGLLFNWNLLGDGEHEVVAYVDDVELGRATVRVTTLGVEFLRDVEGECVAEDFPMPGETVLLEWQQNSQNFVIIETE